MAFNDFKEVMRELGWFERTPDSIETDSSRIAMNKTLLRQYKFLSLYDEHRKQRFDKTLADYLPDGWRIAFGLELFDDMKWCALKSCDEYSAVRAIEDLADGTLMTKDWTYKRDWEEDKQVQYIIALYSVIAQNTCYSCGSQHNIMLVPEGGIPVFGENSYYSVPTCGSVDCSYGWRTPHEHDNKDDEQDLPDFIREIHERTRLPILDYPCSLDAPDTYVFYDDYNNMRNVLWYGSNRRLKAADILKTMCEEDGIILPLPPERKKKKKTK